MRCLSVKSLACFFVLLALPLVAKSKSCRGSLSSIETRSVPQYPKITRDFEKALKKLAPETHESALGYFLTTLFNVVARDYGIEQLDGGLPFKTLSKLPYSLQLDFFTRLKHHPFLAETPPDSLAQLSKSGTPQFLIKEHRETILQILKDYDLPDLEMSILKLSPIEARDIEGRSFEVFYSSNVKELLFQIDIADDGTAVVHSDGKILASGEWTLENGFLKIADSNNIQIDLRRATQTLLNAAHTEVARIHKWGAFALVQVRYLNEEEFDGE